LNGWVFAGALAVGAYVGVKVLNRIP
jgi:hypothetical protein